MWVRNDDGTGPAPGGVDGEPSAPRGPGVDRPGSGRP